MLESGEVESISALAARFHVGDSYVARKLCLAGLVPDIVEMILDIEEADGLSLNRLVNSLPLQWDEQWGKWRCGIAPARIKT